MVETEEYKRYFVTKSGKIWSAKTNKYLKPQITYKGYQVVKLTRSRSECKIYPIHRLVAVAYLPNIKGKDQVNHIDGNKLNNHVSNLEWSSCRDNILYSWESGLHSEDNRKGVNNRQSKLDDEKVLDIRMRLQRGETLVKIAKIYNVDFTLISLIKRNKIWQHV